MLDDEARGITGVVFIQASGKGQTVHRAKHIRHKRKEKHTKIGIGRKI